MEQFSKLAELARSLGIAFISTPFDLESAKHLENFVDAFKIASGDNDFFPLIRQVSLQAKPLIISTGLADLKHVKDISSYIRGTRAAAGVDADHALLHCVSAYPAPAVDANLQAISTLQAALDCEVGYSDHTLGPMACLVAAALGATIIEKHFTLDKNHSDFRDHQLSADPLEMKLIAKNVKEVALLRGDKCKEIQASEKGNALLSRRSIVAARDLSEGEVIVTEDLTWIRPRNGLVPGAEHLLLGRRLVRAVEFGHPILLNDVE